MLPFGPFCLPGNSICQAFPPSLCLPEEYLLHPQTQLSCYLLKKVVLDIFGQRKIHFTLYVCILPSPTTARTVASVTWVLPVLSPTGTQRFGRLGPFYHILLDSFIFVHQCFHLLGCIQQEAVSRSGESSFIQ